jgi:hypothetical protein
VFLGLGAIAILTLAGCGSATKPASAPPAPASSTTTTTVASAPDDSDAGHDATKERDYAAVWAAATPEQRAAATKLVADTKVATAKYADIDAALAAGYQPNPNSGKTPTHFPKQSLMREGNALDPNAPESLMYWTAPDGHKVLVAAVFKTRATETAPTPGGLITRWHTHATGTLCHPATDPGCPQDTGKMLHVFIFPNVHDPFAENPIAAAGGRAQFVNDMRAAGATS